MASELRVLSASFLLISLLIYHGSSAQRCDYTLTGPSAKIASTSSEPYTSDGGKCKWRIKLDQSRKVTLIFDWMNLPCYTNNQIFKIRYYHNGQKYWIGKCGRKTSDLILSFGNKILIQFIPLTNSNIHGFNASYYSTTTGCGAYLNETSGAFTSPGYPSGYASCSWTITVYPGRRIALKFIIFEVRWSTSCSDDKVVVYNGTTIQSGQLGEFCGSVIPAPVKSTGNSMTVQFVSGRYGTGKGFLAVYDTTVVSCGQLQPPSNGQLKPNRHSVNYQSVVNYTCDSGYELVGDGQRTCQVDRTWSGHKPFCQIVSCDGLQVPTNGQLKPNRDSVNYKSVLNYTCNSGYELVGEGQRTCLNNGTLSGHQPSCQKQPTTDSSASDARKDTQIVILGVLLGIVLLIILGLLGYIAFSRHKMSEDRMEMMDRNSARTSTSTVTNAPRSNRIEEMVDMEIEDNLNYDSCEASGGFPRQQGATVSVPSKVGPMTGDIYSGVHKGDAGNIYANT